MILGLEVEEAARVAGAVPYTRGAPVTARESRVLQINLGQIELSRPLREVRFDRVADLIDDPSDPRVLLVLDYRPPAVVEEVEIFSVCPLDSEFLKARVPLPIGEEFSEALSRRTADRLRQELAEIGFTGVRVTPHHEPPAQETIVLGYIIESVPPADLDKVKFLGAGFGRGSAIRKYLREMEPAPFDEGTSVTAHRLIEVEEITRSLMRSEGFLDATVRLSEETKLTDDEEVRAVYEIDRGERYRIGETLARGEVFEDPGFWTATVERYEERTFKTQNLKDLEESIKRRARTEGYMAPEVELDFKRSEEGERIAVAATVDEGTTSSVGAVRINRREPERGYGDSFYHHVVAPPIKEGIIGRQLRVREGEALNQRVIDDAESRLWRLWRFDEVAVDTVPTTGSLSVRDVVLKVRETRTGNFGATIGWNDQLGPVIRTKFSETNVGGRADLFEIGGWFALEQDRGFGGSVSYLDRYWALGERLMKKEREPSLLYTAEYNQYGFDEYTEERVGGRLQTRYLTGEPMGPWSNALGVRLESVSYDPYLDRSRYEEDFDSYTAASLAYHITYDKRRWRDREQVEGLAFDTGLEAGTAGGMLLKWTNQAEYQRPLSRRWGWQSIGQFGVMPMHGSDIGLGERYHLGGLGSLRGFEERGVGPVDGKRDQLQIGGATVVSLQNELRLRLSDAVEVPFFLDAGTLNEGPLEFGGPRASVGLGLRVKLPGTNQQAYIYFAENLLREETDDERRIHFGVRFSF